MSKRSSSSAKGSDEVSTPDKGVQARRLACEILIKVEREGKFVGQGLNEAFARKNLSERDRAFVTALTQGVLRNRHSLDEEIKALSSQKLEKTPAPLLNILRLAFFQFAHMPDIPPQAVVATSCRLALLMGHKGHVSFTNGILRSYLRRQKESTNQTDLPGSDAGSLALSYSMPLYLVEKWLKTWGQDETVRLLALAQKPPKLTLRTCRTAITSQGLADILRSSGLKVRQGELVPDCLIVENHKGPVEKLPGFKEGLFSIQDEAAAFAALVLACEPGEHVLDMCAAPGGKTLSLAEMMEGKGQVVAVDKSEARLKLLGESRLRLGLTNIAIVALDGLAFESKTLFDRILLDAPCTGSGVIARRPDLRFHRREPDLAYLASVQRKLLAKCAGLLKPGGVLVYSTCSLEPEENQENLAWFLKAHNEFQAESLSKFISEELKQKWSAGDAHFLENLDQGFVQLMPSRHDQSGFFVFRTRKGK